MRLQLCGAIGLAMAALLLGAAPLRAARGEQNATAERCGVNFQKPAQRVFADATGRGKWTEYRDIRDAGDVNLDDGALARMWPGREGNTLVRIEQPGEDYSIFTDYCYEKSGGLIQTRFEVRTAWGWGFLEEGAVKDGAISPETREYFDITTRAKAGTPPEAADIREALTPRLYLQMSKLPFAKYLAAAAKSP